MTERTLPALLWDWLRGRHPCRWTAERCHRMAGRHHLLCPAHEQAEAARTSTEETP